MRYDSVQNAEIYLFCSENRNFLIKKAEKKREVEKWNILPNHKICHWQLHSLLP